MTSATLKGMNASLTQVIEGRVARLVADNSVVPTAPTLPACVRGVVEETARQAVVSNQGGKRLRALLAMDAFAAASPEAQDEAREAMLDLACAIEVFQIAALVHDDIIDDSDMRRGHPSAHRALESTTGSASVGVGLGIMLGDALATASVAVAHDAATRLTAGDAIERTFLAMHREVEYGQMLDLAVELADLNDPTDLREASLTVFRWKTASYTTIAPIELALLAAGRSPETARAQALAVGLPLGIAFQLADDLLDVTGSSRNTGKPVGGDIREGKRNVLLADALDGASQADRDWLRGAFLAPSRDESVVEGIMALFASTRAIDRSRERIGQLWDEARHAIDGLGLGARKTDFEAACARFIPTDIR